jgi:arsenical pump membrane protein
VFAWAAVRAIRIAGRSRRRLFATVYGVGILTTALLSNDASPLPYALACALVANAASFVLPISNPSNLLVFAGHMPPLAAWLAAFALPSIVAIALT